MRLEKLSALQNLPLFTGLQKEAIGLLESKASVHRANEGEIILREGDVGHRLFVILSGSVRIFKQTAGGDDIELTRLGPGEFFGEMCILDTLPRSATVSAIEESNLIGLDSMAFLALYEQMPRDYGIMLLSIARDLSRRLRKLDAVYGVRA